MYLDIEYRAGGHFTADSRRSAPGASGLAGRLVVLTMPGSRAAVQLAMERIILPELPHLVREARKGL